MPLVRIDMIEGRSEQQVAAISEAVHEALVETMTVPQRDRFHVITEHKPGRFIFDAGYLEVARTAGLVVVQVFLSAGREMAQKQAFYARAAQLLQARAQVRPEDLLLGFSENTRGDWSFGNGRAQYLELPKEQWR